jgi:hypothetical protein
LHLGDTRVGQSVHVMVPLCERIGWLKVAKVRGFVEEDNGAEE